MPNTLQRAEKILQRINELALISEEPECLTRVYGTTAFLKGRALVEGWMKEAGLTTRVDNIGNIRGRLESPGHHARTFVIASHIDTVANAGKFDGPLGVLMGLDCLEELSRSGTALPFHLELIGFCDEEGCRFHTTYLGSKAVAGTMDTTILGTRDGGGISLEEVIIANGGDVNNLRKDAIARKDWLGYFEMHIEQGPVLYERKVPVGIVTAIAGQRRFSLRFTGEAGHAGTVPMDMRKDALACAAECILAIEQYGLKRKHELVATVGKLDIDHAASNVIPGAVTTTLDLRSADSAVLSASFQQIREAIKTICKKRNIELLWKPIQEFPPVRCETELTNMLKNAIQQAGIEPVELVSGAGHDAVAVSEVAPVTMMFVRCYKGISHNPLENVELADLAAAIGVSDNFMKAMVKKDS